MYILNNVNVNNETHWEIIIKENKKIYDKNLILQ